MDLTSIRPSILELQPHEALDLILSIRKARREFKAIKAKAKIKKATTNIMMAVNKMSPEQAAEMLERLKGR